MTDYKVTFEHQEGRQELVMLVWHYNSDYGRTVDVEVRLDPFQAADFGRTVASWVQTTVDSALMAALRGDCSTCKNMRLIDKPRGGRRNLIHCPDCSLDDPQVPSMATHEERSHG